MKGKERILEILKMLGEELEKNDLLMYGDIENLYIFENENFRNGFQIAYVDLTKGMEE